MDYIEYLYQQTFESVNHLGGSFKCVTCNLVEEFTHDNCFYYLLYKYLPIHKIEILFLKYIKSTLAPQTKVTQTKVENERTN